MGKGWPLRMYVSLEEYIYIKTLNHDPQFNQKSNSLNDELDQLKKENENEVLYIEEKFNEGWSIQEIKEGLDRKKNTDESNFQKEVELRKAGNEINLGVALR